MTHFRFILAFFAVFGSTQMNKIVAQDSTNVAFANYLFVNQEFELAATEYQKLYFLNTDKSEFFVRYVESLMRSNQAEKVLKLYNAETFSSQDTVVQLSIISVAYTLDSLDLLEAMIQNSYLDSGEVTLLNAGIALKQFNRKKTTELLATLKGDYYNRVASFNEKLKNTKFKSKFLAASMSAVIPGTGKFYAGYWKDALFSMIALSLTGFITYRGIEKRGINSGYAIVYGGLTTAFYAGNIYGSAVAAGKKNKIKHQNLVNEFNSILELYIF